jgi:hypothetical protein
MELAGCLQLVVELFDKRKVAVGRLCCDDDSSVRADCKWSNADYCINNNTTVVPMVAKKKGKNKGDLQKRPDKGKLPGHIPEPVFVADPNHRCKGLVSVLIAIDTANIANRFTMTRMDSTRIGKSFGYTASMLTTLADESLYVDAAKAVLEHHFDNHQYCGIWCPRKRMTVAQLAVSERYYRNKKESPELYKVLSDKIGRYIELDRLVEIAHDLDTNMNEAFNNVCTWLAPKNKVYCGSWIGLFDESDFDLRWCQLPRNRCLLQSALHQDGYRTITK